ncbi:hypothetical protein GCM10023215_41920 [Pseudonocardia yuanmonensis]|uniref:Uncharacterized protein n=1 Tax=Pseudonocardia yuanmonensis TaxID=1095914 RepID=A0ABP8X381_9PSEU
MDTPSAVSNRLVPAANSTGMTRIAYEGSCAAAAPTAGTSRVTSVAVSNPMPNTNPTTNVCQGFDTGR